jgi:hypothetical protein
MVVRQLPLTAYDQFSLLMDGVPGAYVNGKLSILHNAMLSHLEALYSTFRHEEGCALHKHRNRYRPGGNYPGHAAVS